METFNLTYNPMFILTEQAPDSRLKGRRSLLQPEKAASWWSEDQTKVEKIWIVNHAGKLNQKLGFKSFFLF